jgi:serine/threonine protein kinase
LIADFGLARLRNERTRDKKVGTNTMTRTQMYEPPDVDIIRGLTSRKYDIWSMGCIFLEFTIWLLSGIEEIKRFKDLAPQH